MAPSTRLAGPIEGYDLVVIGAGMGGGTLAYALRDSGARILLLERGDFLPQEPENWSSRAVFAQQRYKTHELWEDAEGREFRPGVHYYVGGNTKVYGGALPRFRLSDFDETEHPDGVSPRWPLSYADLDVYYAAAERLYKVHGADDDPTLVRNAPYPYPPVPHEPVVKAIAERLRAAGFTPSSLPMAIDLRQGGACIRCETCDGFPCRTLAKGDADVCAVRPALEYPNVELRTGAYVTRLITDPAGGRVTAVEYQRGGTITAVGADRVVVTCGAVNSAALLLRSATSRHPNGLANGSGVVGRHYMIHNNTVMMAVHPFRRNHTAFQQTLHVNDFYERGTEDHKYPLGHIQLTGKLTVDMLAGARPRVPRWVLRTAASRSVDWWLFSEDLPDRDNRVTVTPAGRIRINWRPNNIRSHEILVRETRRMARSIGYPIVIAERTGIAVNSHQAGTVRAGEDADAAAVDAYCRSHEVENLYVVDSAFFPSLPPINPALTIAANAFRVAEEIRRQCA